MDKLFTPFAFLLLISTVSGVVLENCLDGDPSCFVLDGVKAFIPDAEEKGKVLKFSTHFYIETPMAVWIALGLSGGRGMKDMFVMECDGRSRVLWSKGEWGVQPEKIIKKEGANFTFELSGGGGGTANRITSKYCEFTLEKGTPLHFVSYPGTGVMEKTGGRIKDHFYINMAVGWTKGVKHTTAAITEMKVAIPGLEIVVSNGRSTGVRGIPSAFWLSLALAVLSMGMM